MNRTMKRWNAIIRDFNNKLKDTGNEIVFLLDRNFDLHDYQQDNLYFLNFHGFEAHCYECMKFPVKNKKSLSKENDFV